MMLTTGLANANLAVFEALNALVGRSWLLDSIIAAALDNPVIKAGVLGACFFYAWYATGPVAPPTRRRILLVTLLSLFAIAGASKFLSEGVLAPRPFVMAEQTYIFHDNTLSQPEQISFRTIQTGGPSGRIKAMRQGQLEANDLGSFPSDHAAVYFALALGIFLACRRAGAIAMLWAAVVIFAPRIAVGMHWPVDIVAGAAFGAAVLLPLVLVSSLMARWWNRADAWLQRRPALVSAMLFLLLAEVVNTMPTLERAREIVSVELGSDQ